MNNVQETRKDDESKPDASNFWSKIADGFWNFVKSAFTFFEKVLNVLKKDRKLAILWGFAILLLVVLIVTFVLASLSPVMQLGIVVLIVLV